MHRDKERQDVINWQLRTCQTCRVHRLCWSASLLHFTGMRCTTWRARVPMITKCRLGQVSLGWLQPQPRRHATRWWIVSARFVMVGHVLFATRKYWLYLKQNSAQLMMMRWWYFINIIYIWSKLDCLLLLYINILYTYMIYDIKILLIIIIYNNIYITFIIIVIIRAFRR